MSLTVAIVGLGTAGAAAAAFCAERGLRVIGLERGDLGLAGARWVNGVPEWAFEVAGLPLPEAPERRGGHAPVHLVAGWGPKRVKIRGVVEVDMRHLVARLQERAVAAGAALHAQVRVGRFDGFGLDTSAGRVEADVFVDASGLNGPRLLGQPRVERGDLCVAAQQVHALRDRDRATAFFAEHAARPGEVLIFTGVAGGYSIVNVHFDHEHVAVLTGSIPANGHPGGKALLEEFAATHGDWIGPAIFGGHRAIPLRRPWPVVGHGRVAAIGDAACQVYPTHGSGIAQQIVAARVLADALAEGRGPAGYNVTWQRRWGGVLAGSDLFRRFSERLTPGDLGDLMAHDVLAEPMMRDAMVQRQPRPPVDAALKSIRGMLRVPRLGASLAPVLARMQAVQAHYPRYPAEPAARARWVRHLEVLSGLREPRWQPQG